MLALQDEITDAEILQRLEAGEGLAAIAFSRRLATAVLQRRLRRLRERLPMPLNGVEELRRNFDHLAAIRDGCLHLLASPEGAGLDLGPHDFDLEVTVSTGTGRPMRRPLTEFFPEGGGVRLVAIHAKMADPRALLLATLAQMRQQIEVAVKLSERIHDTQALQQFEEEIVHAIDEADPAAGERLRERLQHREAPPLAPRAPGERE